MGKLTGRVWRIIAWLAPVYQFRIAMYRKCGVKIGKGTYIGNLVVFDGEYPEYIEIGDYASIGPGAIIMAHSSASPFLSRTGLFHEPPKKVLIENGAWIASGAIILPGVTIGKGAIVAAGAVVSKNVQAFTIVAGNPARAVRKIKKPNKKNKEN
ncbi:MAG: putative acetyltransferase [Candidatus Heimdallarchaeota archaeon LC_3]|nr:MAG: putative acetyltransferase [Candidatus Heimdallarchaeota archaeon LC_3]